MSTKSTKPEQFCGLFNLPGEGFIAQVRTEMGTFLYDRQGLQYVILERKQQGLCAAAMEEALTHMNHIQEQSSLSVGSN